MARSKGKKDYVRALRATRKSMLSFLSTRKKSRTGGWRRNFSVDSADVAQIKNNKSRADRRRRKVK